MKLHWSPRSPFVRKVMITAHECGLSGDIELVRTQVAMERPHAGLLVDNPLGKIPTLVLEDGRVLFDSTVICEYLAHLAGVRGHASRLFPDSPERFDALCRNALGGGLMDLLVLWRHERARTREAQSPDLLAAFGRKTAAALERIEREVGDVAASRFDIGDVAIGCALAYVDFRFPHLDWRASHPLAASWFERIAQRTSMRSTAIVDDAVTPT